MSRCSKAALEGQASVHRWTSGNPTMVHIWTNRVPGGPSPPSRDRRQYTDGQTESCQPGATLEGQTPLHRWTSGSPDDSPNVDKWGVCWSWTALSRDRRQLMDGQAGPPPANQTPHLSTFGLSFSYQCARLSVGALTSVAREQPYTIEHPACS